MSLAGGGGGRSTNARFDGRLRNKVGCAREEVRKLLRMGQDVRVEGRSRCVRCCERIQIERGRLGRRRFWHEVKEEHFDDFDPADSVRWQRLSARKPLR